MQKPWPEPGLFSASANPQVKDPYGRTISAADDIVNVRIYQIDLAGHLFVTL
jgi:hypothetical protein